MGQIDPLQTSLLHENSEDLEDEEVKNYLLWMDSLGSFVCILEAFQQQEVFKLPTKWL